MSNPAPIQDHFVQFIDGVELIARRLAAGRIPMKGQPAFIGKEDASLALLDAVKTIRKLSGFVPSAPLADDVAKDVDPWLANEFGVKVPAHVETARHPITSEMMSQVVVHGKPISVHMPTAHKGWMTEENANGLADACNRMWNALGGPELVKAAQDSATHNVSSITARDARLALDTGRWPHTPPETN